MGRESRGRGARYRHSVCVFRRRAPRTRDSSDRVRAIARAFVRASRVARRVRGCCLGRQWVRWFVVHPTNDAGALPGRLGPRRLGRDALRGAQPSSGFHLRQLPGVQRTRNLPRVVWRRPRSDGAVVGLRKRAGKRALHAAARGGLDFDDHGADGQARQGLARQLVAGDDQSVVEGRREACGADDLARPGADPRRRWQAADQQAPGCRRRCRRQADTEGERGAR